MIKVRIVDGTRIAVPLITMRQHCEDRKLHDFEGSRDNATKRVHGGLAYGKNDET